MSKDKIEEILATYPPVEGKPGYVWLDKNRIVKLEWLKEEYKKHFEEVGEIKK